MSTTQLKTRHYAALAARLNSLRANLLESEVQLEQLTLHLSHMAQLGTIHGAQFMAVSRLVDLELMETQRKEAELVARAGGNQGEE